MGLRIAVLTCLAALFAGCSGSMTRPENPESRHYVDVSDKDYAERLNGPLNRMIATVLAYTEEHGQFPPDSKTLHTYANAALDASDWQSIRRLEAIAGEEKNVIESEFSFIPEPDAEAVTLYLTLSASKSDPRKIAIVRANKSNICIVDTGYTSTKERSAPEAILFPVKTGRHCRGPEAFKYVVELRRPGSEPESVEDAMQELKQRLEEQLDKQRAR